MAHRLKPLQHLEGAQERASRPGGHAALSASAGTGKTHVLTARVLRLLLSGADPASILCLTFTKAGAAEMAGRIHQRLARWVRLKHSDLAAELRALGEDYGPKACDEARTLFAKLLDSTGGGLRVQTIHAFAQGLLAGFPSEAGLVPGFRPLEGREEQLLARATLAELLVAAEREGDLGLIRDLQALSLRVGEGGAEAFLGDCARAPAGMAALGSREAVEPRLRRLFGLPLGDVEEAIARDCADELFDIASLRRIGAMNAQWATRGGTDRGSICEQWLAATPTERARLLESRHAVWSKSDGELRSFSKGQAPQDSDYPALAESAFNCCRRLLLLRRTAAFVAPLAAGLRAGQAYALAYGAAKRAAGVVDFDDLIREAEKLLLTPGMGEWVRYKLDQQTDHILVDEAQDTNERQWNIVRALALEYFAGEGASRGPRTIFTVGDYKQAIFGFQGTDPQSFDVARAWFARQAEAAEQDFLDLSMDRSFRSSPPILDVVDRVIGELGHQALGLLDPANPHEASHAGRGGSVTLWQPRSEETAEDAGEEGWVSPARQELATKIAQQIRAWLDKPFWLESRKRPLRPEDILILLRSRGDLASLIVARLHALDVPVAGVDRLSLSAPLAVQDLLAAARFAAQPLDDLNLASLLVSPLLGWSQAELYDAAFGRAGALWPHLRTNQPAGRLAGLQSILNMADYAPPFLFFETILSGPLDGRRKLLERLGAEARDPIEELLSSALEFETNAAASLQAFLDWFARGEVEIVRDPSAPTDAVRVMTVHGAKGLQSPVLILADACADPDRAGNPGLRLAALPLGEGEPAIPVFRPRKEDLAEPLKSEVERRDRLDREEHWRLLYVALTRAEERLYIGGALGTRSASGPPEASWYAAVEAALGNLGAQWIDSPDWGRTLRHGTPEGPPRSVPKASRRETALPAWLHQPAPAEERPPRPLAPSSLGEDDVADPPPGPAQRAAAERGKWLHALFERLPAVPAAERRALALLWLERSAGVEDAALRERLADDACAVIADPRFAALFALDALAEAPIAAVVAGGTVVSGTVDRLRIADDLILVADFKTGRNPPAGVDAIPPAHLRQMAAYRAALRVIFPDRAVEAALLYTAAPVLHPLPDALLDLYAPGGG
jgi:ATP-dependent helicase/nuclease subunit A